MTTTEHLARVGSAFVVETAEQRRDRLRAEAAAALEEAKTRHRRIQETLANNRDELSRNDDARIDPDSFRSSPQFMSRAVRRFIHRSSIDSELAYVGCPERMPLDFTSNDAAENRLRHEKNRYLTKKNEGKAKNQRAEHLNLADAVEVFIQSRLGATVMSFDGYDASTLVFYDYDKRLYTFNKALISRWLTVLTGSASDSNIKTFVGTLEGRADRLAIFNPLPRWKIAVGNGVYNTLTRRLEKYSPVQVITNRIQTDYRQNPAEPSFTNGMTFEKLIYDLADGKPDRVELILQMCKAIITGYSATPAIFVMMGSGGDGKSLFMQLISAVIGSANTGALNFSDMEDDSKVVEVVQKRLVVGFDNDQNVKIKKTSLLKSAASREVISLFRKFLTSVALRFTGSVVQLCNSLPRFTETGSSIRRRIIMLLCENSHYENGDEKYGLQENIKNEHWHEYILWYLLNESTTPYFTDFNDCDRAVINNSLDSEDTIGSFYAELESATDAMNHEVLPRNMLYACYLDWMANNYPGANVCSSRTFSAKSDQILRTYGYESTGDKNPTRMSTLEKVTGVSFTAVFGYLAEGQNVQELNESQGVTRVLRKVGKAAPHRNGRRYPKVCSAIQYFELWDEIISDIEHHPLAYKDLFEAEGLAYEPEPVFDATPENVVEPEDTLSALTDESLLDRFVGDYRAYMCAHHLADAEQEDADAVTSAGRLADRITDSVRRHDERFAEKLAPGQQQIVPEVFDPEKATATEFEEATDADLLDQLDVVQRRAEKDAEIATRMMSLRVDLSAAITRGDSQQVDLVLGWLDRCATVASVQDMQISYASLVDRLIAQVTSAAQTHRYTSLHTKLVSIADDDIDVRVEEIKDAAQRMVGSIAQKDGE